MADNKVIDSKVLQELTNKLQDIINNYCWNFENYSDEDIESLFDGTGEEISYYSSLIKDDQVSKNFLHSSKQIADDIAKAILDANEYSESLIKNISTIKLSYVTSLPTSDISENTIYILKAVDGASNDTLNLYNEANGWTNIGEFNISLDDYYTKSETDSLLNDKIDKTSISKTIDENSSDDEIPTSKAVNDRVANLKTSVEISYADYLALSDEEKNNGVAYYIPDLPVSTSGEIIGEVERLNGALGSNVTGLDVGSIIPFVTSSNSNMTITNGFVELKKGKTYRIFCDLRFGYSSGGDGFAFYGIKDSNGKKYGVSGYDESNARVNGNFGSHTSVDYVLTPDENITLGIFIDNGENVTTLYASSAKLTILEIPSYKGLIDVSDEHIKDVMYDTTFLEIGDLNNLPIKYKTVYHKISNSDASSGNISNLPVNYGGLVISIGLSNVHQFYFSSTNNEVYKRYGYYVSDDNIIWANNWENLCKTKIDDVPYTDITGKINSDVLSGGTLGYQVVNGICFLEFNNISVLKYGDALSCLSESVLPKCKPHASKNSIPFWYGKYNCLVTIESGMLKLWCSSEALADNPVIHHVISYPVAES